MPPGDSIVACSNDYLGYAWARNAGDPILGAGGSRLVVGDAPEQVALEEELADWTGQSTSLVFSSGYAANVGLISALAGPGDLIVSQALNHASIIDGCRLSRATVRVVEVGDTAAVSRELGAEARRKFVVTESYFSMDGLVADLAGLRAVCDEAGAALLVDEAHALGVFGATGAGMCERAGVRPDAVVGTLGKALGGQGAFVGGSEALVLWLWNRARSFVFSTGMSPALCLRLLANVRRARGDDEGRRRLHRNAELLRSLLRDLGVAVLAGSVGPIVPVVVGDSEQAVAYQQRLMRAGYVVRAIRPPTVPEGTARLRVTVSAAMSERDIEGLAEAIGSSRCAG